MPAYGRKFKVRTGCITCKIRKIKCDEAKPACLRCSSTGRKCDGYASPGGSDDSKEQRGLVWRPRNHEAATTTTAAATLHANITVLPGVESADEHQWLEYFSHHAGPTLSEIADTYFWTHILPQLSVAEPAIRHALLAVGSSYARFDASTAKGRALATATEHSYSIKHYSRAITELRKSLAKNPDNETLPLICCLLFICLECLYGNRILMLDHLNNGLNILSSTLSRGTDGTSKRNVTEKLEQIFRRLDAQASLYGRPVTLTNVILSGTYDMGIPYRFSDVYEAKRYLDKINTASLTFIPFTPDHEGCIARSENINILLVQRRLQEQFMSWRNALDNFAGTTSVQDATHEDHLITRLRIESCASFIYLSNCLDIEESSYDSYTIQFASIVSLARKVMTPINDSTIPELSTLSINPAVEPPPGNMTGFSLEASLIPSLYLTALKCRDPLIRREAISMLGQNHGREGLWDGRLHWKVARRVLEIEERNVLIQEGASDAYMEDPPSLKMQASNGAALIGFPCESLRVQSADIFRGIEEASKYADVVFYTRPNGIPGQEHRWTERIPY